MIDGFPSSASDCDYAMQSAIGAELQNAKRVRARFDADCPIDPKDPVESRVKRMGSEPGNRELYPKLMGAEDHHAWLLPLLRRLAWHDANPDQSRAVWKPMLARIIELAVEALDRVNDDEFVALTDLAGRWKLQCEKKMGPFARQLEKDGPLSGSVAQALGRLRGLADRNGDIFVRGSIVWPFFRSPVDPNDPDPCWSARVRRDLESMEPQLRGRWQRVFLIALDENFEISKTPGKAERKTLQALGNAELEGWLRRWTGMLHDDPGPVLTPTGAFVLRRVIILCHLLGGAVCDELLYNIARAPWTAKPEHPWMYVYLMVLGSRPQDRAFACLEALMMNQVTAIDEVRRQYDALMAVFGAGAVADSQTGVDGFPLDSDPALLKPQRRIDQLLRMAQSAAAHGPYVDPQVTALLARYKSMKETDVPPAFRESMKQRVEQLSRPDPWFNVSPEVRAAHKTMEACILKAVDDDIASLHRAVSVRMEWIEAHKQEYTKDTLQIWSEWLGGLGSCDGLINRSLAKVENVSSPESLLRTIRTAPGHSKVLELTEKYVAEHGWTLELVEAFREWIPTLGVAASTEMDRARSEWLVWFEDVTPIDLEACWSHRIKRDLREMPKKEAAAWRALLDNHTFVIPGRAPKKWIKAGEDVFPKIGAGRFRRRFVAWFEPFAKGEPLRTRATGRNILRTLMWYALIAKDPEVDAALLGFANAKWKTKQLTQLAAKMEKAFSYVIAERMPESALPILEGFVSSGQAFEGSPIHKIYQDLCARRGHKPVVAIPEKPKPGKPGPSAADREEAIQRLRRLLVLQQLGFSH